MSDGPWITIVGLGEDGLDGLPPASRSALERAEIVMGPQRHLDLIGSVSGKVVAWPVPFSSGIDVLKGFKGQRVAVLASGDPFWFGAGAVIARHFEPGDWTCLPGPSVFSLVASRLGWALDRTICLGLHAAPMERLRPHLADGARLIVTLRDGAAVTDLARYLCDVGANESRLTVAEAVGGPNEKITRTHAADALDGVFTHPVAVAIEPAGSSAALPRCSGLPDDIFETDGVMTKRPVRALTLSALAPQPGEMLWDIGGGSGSIAIEWLLADPDCQAIAVESRADRVGMIQSNARALGVDRLQVVQGSAPDALSGLDQPDAIFIGGGLSQDMIDALPRGVRIVANGVTLEAEALLTAVHKAHGGDLMRIEIARAKPLGAKRGWDAAYPIVQWVGML